MRLTLGRVRKIYRHINAGIEIVERDGQVKFVKSTKVPYLVFDLQRINEFLSDLDNSELVDFCIGDEADQAKLMLRSVHGLKAHDLLNFIFNSETE